MKKAIVIENLTKRFNYIFETENKYPGAPSVTTFEVKNDIPFYINKVKIIPINVNHGTVQVFGYRLNNFTYLTDVKSIEEIEIEKVKGTKILVINALREETHHSHFNLQDALNFIHLIQPEKAYLTHISHLLGFHEEVQKNLPENVFLAYDNLEIFIK